MEHRIIPGTLEVLKYLYSKSNIQVAFFSSGHEKRNEEFVRQLLIKALGLEHYNKIKDSLIVLSRTDLTPTDPVLDEQRLKRLGIRPHKNKKNLEKIVANRKNAFFKKSSLSEFSYVPNYSSIQERAHFERGISLVQKVNPKMQFVSREDYHSLLKEPADDEEDAIIKELNELKGPIGNCFDLTDMSPSCCIL